MWILHQKRQPSRKANRSTITAKHCSWGLHQHDVDPFKVGFEHRVLAVRIGDSSLRATWRLWTCEDAQKLDKQSMQTLCTCTVVQSMLSATLWAVLHFGQPQLLMHCLSNFRLSIRVSIPAVKKRDSIISFTKCLNFIQNLALLGSILRTALTHIFVCPCVGIFYLGELLWSAGICKSFRACGNFLATFHGLTAFGAVVHPLFIVGGHSSLYIISAFGL